MKRERSYCKKWEQVSEDVYRPSQEGDAKGGARVGTVEMKTPRTDPGRGLD